MSEKNGDSLKDLDLNVRSFGDVENLFRELFSRLDFLESKVDELESNLCDLEDSLDFSCDEDCGCCDGHCDYECDSCEDCGKV